MDHDPRAHGSIWHRLCVDIDRVGNIIGASIEHRDADRITVLTVLPEPGPFDTIDDVWPALLERCHAQGVLFP